MTPSKLNVAYSFSWFLPDADTAQVREIIESLRHYAIDLGSEAIGSVVVLIGKEAQAVRSDFDQVIVFSATIPSTQNPRCETDEYATSFLMSCCTHATSAP